MDESCWLWAGKIDTGTGYGRIKLQMAHRVVYEAVHGLIPDGMQLDHLCRVRYCVNPNHLEVVTRKENILRGNGVFAVNARKTHCKSGHEFTSNNVYSRSDRLTRECKVCRKLANYKREESLV